MSTEKDKKELHSEKSSFTREARLTLRPWHRGESSPLGVFLALLSFACIMVLLVGIMFVSAAFQQAASFYKLQEHFSEISPTVKDKILSELFAEKAVYRITDSFLPRLDPLLRHRLQDELKLLLLSHEAVEHSRFLRASQIFQSISATSDSNTPLSGVIASGNRPAVERITKEFSRAVSNYEERDRSREKRDEAQEEQQELLEQRRLLARDLGGFFTLSPAAVEKEELRRNFGLYLGGVLAGLPKLEGIKDNLPSLDALAAEVSALEGAVAESGPGAQRKFRELCQRLRAAARELSKTYLKLEQEVNFQQKNIDDLTILLEAQRKRLLEFTEGLFFRQLSSMINPVFFDTYFFIQEYLEGR